MSEFVRRSRTLVGLATLSMISFAVLAPASAYSETAETELRSLRRINGVGVTVGVSQEGCPIDEASLQTLVERRLREAGIEGLTREGPQKPEPARTKGPMGDGGAVLALFVSCSAEGDRYAITLNLQLAQAALLHSLQVVVAITWSEQDLVTGSDGKPLEQLRRSTEELVDQFIADFKKANPKTQSGGSKPPPDPLLGKEGGKDP